MLDKIGRENWIQIQEHNFIFSIILTVIKKGESGEQTIKRSIISKCTQNFE